MPVTPARLRWRLTRAQEQVVPWQVACDFRTTLHPKVQGNPASDLNFATIYAPDTTQSHQNTPGTFHLWLKRGFDTDHYPDGQYLLEVEASDVRGNARTGNLPVTFANAG